MSRKRRDTENGPGSNVVRLSNRQPVRQAGGAGASAGDVVRGEVVTTRQHVAVQLRKTQRRYAGYRHTVYAVGRVTRTAATHQRTRTAWQHVTYPFKGVAVVAKRWRDSHGAGRYERMMRAAEAAGDHEALLEWEARDVAEKERRHRRVMDWVKSPLDLVKAFGVLVLVLAGLLLVVGIILAIRTEDVHKVLAPIEGVLDAIAFTWWVITAYGVFLLVGGTGAAVAYLYGQGRKHAEPPAWTMPGSHRVLSDGALVTPPAVVNALRHLGIAELRKAINDMADDAAGLLSSIVIAGCGVEVDVTLPRGISTEEIQKRRRKLAENLDRHEHELFITIPKRARTVRLWVADPGALDEPIEASPLVTSPPKQVSMHRDRAPWGLNLRGDAVSVNLWQKHLLITGMSNMGKTVALRSLALWLALDPTVEFHIADLKGLGDWRMFRGLAKTYIEGPTDDHVIAATEMLEAGVREMERRLTSFDADKYPDGVPPGLPGYHPIVMIVDEAQVAYMCPAVDEYKNPYGGKSNRSRFLSATRRLNNQGRAVNALDWQGTQDPTDQNLPKLARESFHIRAGLRVGTSEQSRMALGDAAVNDGAAPHELQAEHKGTVVVTGPGIPYQQGQTSDIVRTHYINGTEGTAIAEQAKQLRNGRPAAEEEHEERDHLADIARVIGEAGQPRMRTQEVLQRLAALDEAEYRPWTPARLTEFLTPFEAAPYKSNGVMMVSAARVAEALADLAEQTAEDTETGFGE